MAFAKDLGPCALCSEREAVWQYGDETWACCDKCLTGATVAIQSSWPVSVGESLRRFAMSMAERVAEVVMRDLSGRCGVLDDVDHEVRAEMLEELTQVIAKELSR